MTIGVGSYRKWLGSLKDQILESRTQAALSANKNMLLLYWFIGEEITQKIDVEGWGTKVIDQLADDFENIFPGMRGFSVRSLLYMKQFHEACPNLLITQQPVAQLKHVAKATRKTKVTSTRKTKATSLIKKSHKIEFTQQPFAQFAHVNYFCPNPVLTSIPWGHPIFLMDKITNEPARLWYIQKTVENNWSRAVLQYQVETDLYLRQHKVKKASDFHVTLPKPQADLANEILKDPYVFRFPRIGEFATQGQLEAYLLFHIRDFILELGAGFAFVGSQVNLKAGGKDSYIDLLFYHLFLRSYVVIELKMTAFELSHTGQMNGYLNIVNKQIRQPHDNPSIGIILCAMKDNVEVEFALTNINHPIGVSEYTFSKVLPSKLKSKMPSAKQFQDQISKFFKKINTP